jgi:hypothetical protein
MTIAVRASFPRHQDFFATHLNGENRWSRAAKPYKDEKHSVPHASALEFFTGLIQVDVARNLRVTFTVESRLLVMDGDASRTVFNRCWFDRDRFTKGSSSLENYKKEIEESYSKLMLLLCENLYRLKIQWIGVRLSAWLTLFVTFQVANEEDVIRLPTERPLVVSFNF